MVTKKKAKKKAHEQPPELTPRQAELLVMFALRELAKALKFVLECFPEDGERALKDAEADPLERDARVVHLRTTPLGTEHVTTRGPAFRSGPSTAPRKKKRRQQKKK